MSTIGKRFLAACVADGHITTLLSAGPVAHLFRATEVPLYEFVSGFVKKYAKLPSPETIKLNVGEGLPEVADPPGYFLDLLKARYKEQELKRAMKMAADHLGVEAKDADAAMQVMAECIMDLMQKAQGHKLVDFREAYDDIVGDYVATYAADDLNTLYLGWPSFDEMCGGLRIGDVLSIVGRPAAGKTYMMLFAAMHGWKRGVADGHPEHAQSRLFVSMEMGKLPIEQRMAAIHAHLPAHKIKNAALTTHALGKMKDALVEVQGYPQPFWIVDGNLTATVEDIWALARQLKPGAIFIDGGYLLQHPTERDRYRRVAENANLIKQELSPLCPTAVSWQFAKPKNKMKGEKQKLDGDDIGYTDAIQQVSSVTLGLSQPESVETMWQRTVDVLKGRHGEVGAFKTRWDFQNMDFTEIEEESLEELTYGV